MNSDNPLTLTASVDGQPIVIAATTSPGTVITNTIKSSADSGVYDQIHLWAINNDTVARELTLQMGDTISATNLIITLQPKVPTKILDGVFMYNNRIVRGFCPTTDVIRVWGYIDRWTRPSRLGN